MLIKLRDMYEIRYRKPEKKLVPIILLDKFGEGT